MVAVRSGTRRDGACWCLLRPTIWIVAIALVFGVVSSSAALDLDEEALFYTEDFEGESSFPLSAEVDQLAIGSLVSPLFSPAIPFSLTGSAARAAGRCEWGARGERAFDRSE